MCVFGSAARSRIAVLVAGAIGALLPGVVFAAFDDVTITDVTVQVVAAGSALSVTADTATIESLTVDENTFNVTLRGGSTTTVTAASKTEFSVTPSTDVTIAFVCGSNSSTLTLSGGNGTFTISPHGNTCAAAATTAASTGGGAGGGTSGSYGRAASPAPPPPALPVAPTPPVAVAPPAAVGIVSDLAVGSRGEEVSKLQTLLAADRDIYPEGIVTGYFGPATVRAVKRFQARHGLPTVGRVGPATRAKLTEVFAVAPSLPAAPPPPPSTPPSSAVVAVTITQTLRAGASGSEVEALQAFLAGDPALYPEGRVTGYFGPLTEAAVRRFQERHGIEAIGIVGPKTRAKIHELLGASPAASTTPPPAAAPSGETERLQALQAEILRLQEQLRVLQGR